MTLEKIKNILEKEHFDCSYFSEKEKNHLLLHLGFDDKKREKVLEIAAYDLPISPEHNSLEQGTLPLKIQFKTIFPFKIEDSSLNQVASFFLFINQLIEFPGFELDELNGIASFRYVWLTDAGMIEPPLVLSIIGSIMMNLVLFSDNIESLSMGDKTFNDLLEVIARLTASS